MRATKIVATIGPASREADVLEAMVAAGLDVARLNFGHGTPDEHAQAVERVRAAERAVGRRVAVLQDVPGPKVRIGPVQGGVAELAAESRVVLRPARDGEPPGTASALPVAAPGLTELLGRDDVVYLGDGAVRLRVEEVRDDEVVARVEAGGTVVSRQGITLPGRTPELPAVGDDDLRLIDAGVEMGVDVVAASFVRRPEDLEPVRERLRARSRALPVLAKVERRQAAEQAEEIAEAADGLVIARGDLGIELPIEDVPAVQKRLIEVAGRVAKPAVVAEQMLESMVRARRPTRAEVADVANAIFDGADAVMLSQETAVGEYPVDAVRMAASVADVTERELPYGRWLTERGHRGADVESAIAFGAVGAVYQLDLKALVIPTKTGATARLVSSHRPNVPVLALTDRPEVLTLCELLWGVQGELFEEAEETRDLLDRCVAAAKRTGVASPGDRIGITAGLPTGRSGGTNVFNVRTVE